MEALAVFDVLLLILATARGTRLITTDGLGAWWILNPVYKRASGTKWAKYAEGLECSFCVGTWIGLAALTTLMVAGGPGDADTWWRFCAGILALNYVAGHLGSRLD